MPSSYWAVRKNLDYYRVVRRFAETYCPHGKMLLDVGGGVLMGAKYLEWFEGWERTSVEHGEGKDSIPGVSVIESEFLEWPVPTERYDLCLCLQVLEHQRDDQIQEFVRRLLLCGKILIVSVPLNWPKGACKYHPQDPVSKEKFLSWFPMKPVAIEECRENGAKLSRMIAVFDATQWPER